MTRLALPFLLAMLMTTLGQAQAVHEILMMSGKVIEGTVTGQDSLYLYYDLYKRSGKAKSKKLDLERVFSINSSGEEERVIYYEDTAVGNDFSIEEMRLYIKGEQDAMKHYKGNWTILLGVPLTGGLSYLLSPSVFTFAVPFTYLVGTGLPKYKIPEERLDEPMLVKEPAYVLGFERVARNKRLFKSLAAGLIGTTAGFVLQQSPLLDQ